MRGSGPSTRGRRARAGPGAGDAPADGPAARPDRARTTVRDEQGSGEAAATDGAGGRLRRIGRVLGGIPRFGQLLYRLLGDPRVSLLDKALFGATLVYLFVPVDVVPDWIPGLGQADDLVLILFALDRLLYRTDEALLREHWQGDPRSLDALRDLLERAADVLPGWMQGLLRAG